jgi:membrane-associated phospholipid phosphatase
MLVGTVKPPAGGRSAVRKNRPRLVAARSSPVSYGRRVVDGVGLFVSVIVFLTAAMLIDGDRTVGMEGDVFDVFNGLPGFLYPIMWVPMQFGNLFAIPAAAAVAAAARRWRLAIAFLLAGVAKWVVSALVKDAVVRHRPGKFLEDAILRGDTPALGQAFVSGHAMIAVAVATLAHPHIGTRSRALLWGAAVVVCVGRMYTGAHLPLDVVGGAALGAAIGSALNLLFGVPTSSREVADVPH